MVKFVEYKYDLLLVDLEIPEMDGDSALKEIGNLTHRHLIAFTEMPETETKNMRLNLAIGF